MTKKEQQVYKQIIEGLSNKELALFFSISLSTVKNHVTSILKKKNRATRAKLIVAYYLYEE